MNQIVFFSGICSGEYFLFTALHPAADFICMVSETEKRRKTRGIFYWSCVLPALFLRCRHNCECFDFFNSRAFILFQCKKSSGLLGTVRSLLPWYSFDYRSIYRIEVCNEKNVRGKENALIFGVGMGGFESILNGATVYITNIIAALLINSIGSTEYFKNWH